MASRNIRLKNKNSSSFRYSRSDDLHKRRAFLQAVSLPWVVCTLGGADNVMAAVEQASTPYNHVGKGGLLIQSKDGNFELVVPGVSGNLDSYLRLNDRANFPWLESIGLGIGSRYPISGAAQITSSWGNTELVAVEQGRIKSWWRGELWEQNSSPNIADAQGWPGFIQSTYGRTGNFELVVGKASGGMAHFYRNNDATLRQKLIDIVRGKHAWQHHANFGSGNVKGVSLQQVNFLGANGKGNLVVLAWIDDRVEHWYCRDGTWNYAGVVLASGVGGSPAFIQSNWGSAGNYEALIPLASGGLQYCTRNNDSPNAPWTAGALVGTEVFRAVGLIQGTLGGKGNFEAAALAGNRFVGFHRKDNQLWYSSKPEPVHPITGDSAELGRSEDVVDAMVTGINATLLSTGKVLMYGYPHGGDKSAMIQAAIFDPVSKAVSTLSNIRNQFCSGQTPMFDGKVLLVGGHIGDTLKDVSEFDPATSRFTRKVSMTVARWYPSVTALADGSVFIISGTHAAGWTNDVENTWQIYTPGKGLGGLRQVPRPFSPHFPSGQANIDLYPLVYQMPDGKLLIHARNTTRFLDLTTGKWSTTVLRTVSEQSRTYPFMGGSLMLAFRPSENFKLRVLVTGGSSNSADTAPGANFPITTQAASDCELLDMSAPAPAWRQVASMNISRLMHDTVLLPDGTVLAIGGNRTGKADFGNGPTYRPELYDPVANTWTLLASTRIARGYHACALLLPDGRVAVMGKDGDYQGDSLTYAESRIETYSPPYLFRGPRPVITSAPSTIKCGEQFIITCDKTSAVGQAVLIRCGSVTHQNNFSQRLVELTVKWTSATKLTAITTSNQNILPPGHYMLFLMGKNGVPSVSVMVQVVASSTLASNEFDSAAQEEFASAVSLEDAGEAPYCAGPSIYSPDLVALR